MPSLVSAFAGLRVWLILVHGRPTFVLQRLSCLHLLNERCTTGEHVRSIRLLCPGLRTALPSALEMEACRI